MKKNKLIITALLAAASVLMVSISYAWYVNYNKINSFKFKMARINTVVTLYSSTDTNYNGVPDKDKNGNYLFTYIGEESAVTDDISSSVSLNMLITDIMPTQIYTFKVHVKNESEVANSVRFTFVDYLGADGSSKISYRYIKAFSVNVGEVLSDGSVAFNKDDKTYLANAVNSDGTFSVITAKEGVIVSGTLDKDSSGNSVLNETDCWLRFELETYADLQSSVTSNGGSGAYLNVFSDENDYMSVKGAENIIFPLLKVYIEA